MSAAIAAAIAPLVFAGLLIYGLVKRQLARKAALVFALLYVAGRVGSQYVPYGGGIFPAFVAVLDIVLVLMIFKGDVRLL